MNNYLEQLNDVQRKSVEQIDGPVLIIAGAGSGKTRVLTYRIAHLIRQGTSPFNILALTFTNKAAKEMKERVMHLTEAADAQNLWIGTFHSVFSRILRMESEKLGYPSNFTVYDTIDSKNQLKAIVKEKGLDEKVYKPAIMLNRISLAKNNLISPEQYIGNGDFYREDKISAKPEMGSIYKEYVHRCFKAGAMDFDDLLTKTEQLLSMFPEVLHKYQHRFQYSLIDEFQDTNLLQYSIVKRLSAINENICVVGDDAQSIYAFRGANIQNILNFKRDYPDLKVFKLEQNYRSTNNIVKAANGVISNNQQQLHKKVWTGNQDGEKVSLIEALTDNEEGYQVARAIFDRKANHAINNKDIAILYRTNAQSRSMEEALRKLNIPYKVYGGVSFYQRKEVKDLLAYFRLSVNNNDEEAFKRVINYPARGIGLRTIEKIFVAANEKDTNPWRIMDSENITSIGIAPASVQKIIDFAFMIKSFSAQIKSKTAFELGEEIASSTGLLKDLYNNQSPEGLSRYENVQELLNGLKEFTENWAKRNAEVEENAPSLGQYLQDIALLTDQDLIDPEDNNRVSLMTIHSAKGLEFPVVFIVGMEENLFPSQLSLNSREDLEEERRLFYVALTRAMRKAYLSFAKTRYRWGTLSYCEPSRFLEEVDQSCVEKNATPKKQNTTIKPQLKGLWEKRSAVLKKKPTLERSVPKSPPISSQGKRLVNMENAVHGSSINFESSKSKLIEAGVLVEHQRFGFGKVLQIEGVNDNRKAIVSFDKAGEKQLLLKYAKLRIIEQGS